MGASAAKSHGLAGNEPAPLEKRLVCNQDNVLRALQSNSAAASLFCVTFGHIPIPTITIPKAGVRPTVITTSSFYGKTFYPDGRYLQSIAVPPYVSQYSATRTTTTTYIATRTLTSDAWGTRTTYAGGYTLATGDPRESIVKNTIPDAFNCCVECQVQLKGDCVAWVVIPGVGCTLIESPSQYRSPRCLNGLLNGTVGVNLAKYPDALAGVGPCAGTLTVSQG
ncbi:MAG: hypothetical protein Q9203_005650 [Teloschistes exilis]